jgi:G3E family GTPase
VNESDERSVSDLLVEQVEFANVIVINKTDLVSPDEAAWLESILRHLNPEAVLLRSRFGEVEPRRILNTGLFDFEKAARAPGWLKELRGEHTPETLEYGIASFVYRARRPFHPGRFWDFLYDVSGAWDGVLRSKGFFWLASRHDMVGLWSQAGSTALYEAAGFWFASRPPAEWPADPENRAQLERDWQEPFGDRRQELVFIGAEMDEALLRERLDGCLLDDGELAAEPQAWTALRDPFPRWALAGQEDAAEVEEGTLSHRQREP